MGALWPDPGPAEVRRARTEVLDDLRLRGDLGPAAWSLFPHVAVGIGRAAAPAVRRRQSELRAMASGLTRSAGPTIRAVGPVAFVSTSAQNARVLDPVAAVLADEHGPPVERTLPPLGPRGAARAIAEGRALADMTARQLRSVGLVPPGDLLAESLKAATFLRRSAGGLDGIDLVVVGTQHNVVTRAVLAGLGAQARTAYIPHAPTATNVAYADLPVTHALLRGNGDVGLYSALGADPERIVVVGDPDGRELPVGGDGGDVVVFAAPVVGPDEARRLAGFMDASGIGPVEVCVHPRVDRVAIAAVLPDGWTISPTTTTRERLERGDVAVVVQRASGAGLDALRMGIPVVELVHPGRPSNYAYLEDERVPKVTTSDELATAVADLRGHRPPSATHAALGATWVSAVGPVAARAAAAALEAALVAPARGRILDRWASPGA